MEQCQGNHAQGLKGSKQEGKESRNRDFRCFLVECRIAVFNNGLCVTSFQNSFIFGNIHTVVNDQKR